MLNVKRKVERTYDIKFKISSNDFSKERSKKKELVVVDGLIFVAYLLTYSSWNHKRVNRRMQNIKINTFSFKGFSPHDHYFYK